MAEDGRGRGAPKRRKDMNRLAGEKSPYLLQHAGNPVDWYPWGDEAFAKALGDDRPIFLSVGYATCHWCHVMAHESFEDEQVARLLNDAFVCIKVDREERPDIDAVYMTVCQMMTGSGGWPLTIVMTPDKKPFYAATYIPRESRFGRPGLLEILPRIKAVWAEQRRSVLEAADQVALELAKVTEGMPGTELNESVLALGYDQLRQRYDERNGGFGDAPKFPSPHNLLFLLRYWRRTGEQMARVMVEGTLRAMRRGGVYDQIGFGFHRYATDAAWLVPHFEKMLYDQALLAIACVETWQVTGHDDFLRTAREVIEYVRRDMTSPEGAFYSAEDADSEGEEGKFYLWTEDEICQTLDKPEADLAVRVFGVRPGGNYTDEATGRRSGRSILYMAVPLEKAAGELGMSEADALAAFERARTGLLAARAKRVRPQKDDKILTDWNGLMIAALAKAAAAMGEAEYAEAASRAADFALARLRGADGRLLRVYRGGEARGTGNLDDYAFLTWGLIELYEANFDPRWLAAAVELARAMRAHFEDVEGGGFWFTAHDAEKLLVRRKEVYDGAVPSGNSVAMMNLLRLSRLTGDTGFEEAASRLERAFSLNVKQLPVGYTQLLCATDFALGPTREVVVAGRPGAADTEALLRALRSAWRPHTVVLLRPVGGKGEEKIMDLSPFTRSMGLVGGRAAAYVCEGFQCREPVTDAEAMLRLLDGG